MSQGPEGRNCDPYTEHIERDVNEIFKAGDGYLDVMDRWNADRSHALGKILFHIITQFMPLAS